MVFHSHGVQFVQGEFADALNQDGELAAEKECLGLEVDLLIHSGGRKDVVADADVVNKDTLEFGGLGGSAKNLIFLERLQVVDVEIADNRARSLLGVHKLRRYHLLAFFVAFVLLFGVWAFGFDWSHGLGNGHRHGDLLNDLNVFSVDEIHRVGVDDARVVRLAFNLEIVRNQTNGTLGVLGVGWPKGLAAECTSAATATTRGSTALVATATLVVVIGSTTLVAAALTATLVVLVMLLAAAIPWLLLVSLVKLSMRLVVALILLVLLLPGLLALHMLLGLEATLVVLLVLRRTAAHVRLLGGALPVLLPVILVVPGRKVVVLLHIVVLHLRYL